MKVYVGGGSDSVAISSGQIYVDEFAINKGGLLEWPPKTDIDGDGYIDWFDLEMLGDQWLNSGSGWQGDINGDNEVNFEDFSWLAEVW